MHTHQSTLTLWLITDDKPGHRNQLEGLRAALALRRSCTSHWISAPPVRSAWLDWMRGRADFAGHLPAPDLILLAGHRSHPAGLAARRSHGGRLVVLMRPSLPLTCFDLSIIPEHDRAPVRENVVRSTGVLNPMRPGQKQPGSCAILIGGESRHFSWDHAAVINAVHTLRTRWPDAVVTDSRRSPTALRDALAPVCGPHYHPWEHCPPGWLSTTLARTETAWITADSVSMVYEALSAGCATGVIELPSSRSSSHKVTKGLQTLLDNGTLTRFSDYLTQGRIPVLKPPVLAEADRIAVLILERFSL